MKKFAHEYEEDSQAKLLEVKEKTKTRYDKIPKSLREKEMNSVKLNFLKSRQY